MKIDELKTNLAETPKIARRLKANCQALKTSIDAVLAVLNIPKEVHDKLESLSKDLGTLSGLLRLVRVVRPVRLLSTNLRKDIDQFKKKVDAAEGKAKATDTKIKPFRQPLQKLSTTLGAFIKALDVTIDSSTKTLGQIKEIHKCIEKLPNQALRRQGLDLLNDFAKTTNPPVLTLNRTMTRANNKTEALINTMKAIASQLNDLKKIIAGIANVRERIDPIMGPLRELARALDKKIKILDWSFSVRQILEGIKLPWPFDYLEEQFWSWVNNILDPILAKLNLKIQLPGIPALNILGKINLNPLSELPAFMALHGDLTLMFENMQALLARFDVKCPPKKDAVKVSVQLMAEFKGKKLKRLKGVTAA